ncbi:MAG: hypothetical protein ACJ77J_03140, partial [Gemmatimonadaceae bacterium]
ANYCHTTCLDHSGLLDAVFIEYADRAATTTLAGSGKREAGNGKRVTRYALRVTGYPTNASPGLNCPRYRRE